MTNPNRRPSQANRMVQDVVLRWDSSMRRRPATSYCSSEALTASKAQQLGLRMPAKADHQGLRRLTEARRECRVFGVGPELPRLGNDAGAESVSVAAHREPARSDAAVSAV